MTPTRFPWRDETGIRTFLQATPRALVLFAGEHCPYSATLLPHFQKAAQDGVGGWAYGVRELSETDDLAWDAHQVEVTPTVVGFESGRESVRLEGKRLLGITRPAFQAWLRALPGPA